LRERAAALTGCRAFALRGCWVLVVPLVFRALLCPAARSLCGCIPCPWTAYLWTPCLWTSWFLNNVAR